MSQSNKGFLYSLDKSAVLTVIGILILFSMAILVTLIAPAYVDKSWTQPSSAYQKQMYEVADPNLYISTSMTGSDDLKLVYHVRDSFSLLAFSESETVRIIAPSSLEHYITKLGDENLKLTSRLLLLRKPGTDKDSMFDAAREAKSRSEILTLEWEKNHPNWKEQNLRRPRFEILELYAPHTMEAFVLAKQTGLLKTG